MVTVVSHTHHKVEVQALSSLQAISSFTVSCKKKEILTRVFGATSATSATLNLNFPAGAIGR